MTAPVLIYEALSAIVTIDIAQRLARSVRRSWRITRRAAAAPPAAAAAVDEGLEAVADAVRDPAPAPARVLTGTILRPDEVETLNAAAASLAAPSAAIAAEGYNIADFLRQRLPTAPDAELGRMLIAMLWVSRRIAFECDDLTSAYGALTESITFAALHLTELERTDVL